MVPEDQEAEMQAFLRRVVPGFPQQCVGATEDQIQRLDRLSGGRLPGFYRWFLRTMGGDPGPLEPLLNGFAVRNVLKAHDSQFETPPELFLIAASDDELMPIARYYDLDASVRDDALVLVGALHDTEADPTFETLREKVAWSVALVFGVIGAPHRCKGKFRGSEDSVSSELEAMLESLGFTAPVAPQRYCKVMEARDATLVCTMPPDATDKGLFFFRLGGSDPGGLRGILGEIAEKTSIEVEIDKWQHGEKSHQS